MKKLLLILSIILISVGLLAQRKTTGNDVQPFSDQDALHNISIGNIDDSILVHRGLLTTMLADIEMLKLQHIDVEDTVLLEYLFELDLIDETENNYDGTEIGTNLYNTNYAGKSTGTVLNMHNGVNSASTPSVDITNKFNIGIDFGFTTTNEPRRILFGNANFYANVNPTNLSFQFVTINGTDSLILDTGIDAYEIISSYPPIMHRFDVIGDVVAGTGEIYIDGLPTNATGSMRTDFTTTGVIYIGADANEDFPLYGSVDNFKIITGTVTASEVRSRYLLNEYYAYTPITDKGQGRVLWAQSFNTEALDANVTSTEAKAIWGEPCDANNFDSSGKAQIKDAGGGDHYFYVKLDIGESNANSGIGMVKRFNDSWGATDTALMNKKEMWHSMNVKVGTDFKPAKDGKFIPGGFIAGWYPQKFGRAETGGDDSYDTWEDGVYIRSTYDDNSGGAHIKVIRFWKDALYYGGEKSGVWYPDWPTNSEPYIKLPTTEWMNIACRLRLNTDAPGNSYGNESTDAILEWYVNERLAWTDYGKNYSFGDSITIDAMLNGFFCAGDDVVTDDWIVNADDIYIFNFTDGDSTLTGDEHMGTPYLIDVPGYPKSTWPTDSLTWGTFPEQ